MFAVAEAGAGDVLGGVFDECPFLAVDGSEACGIGRDNGDAANDAVAGGGDVGGSACEAAEVEPSAGSAFGGFGYVCAGLDVGAYCEGALAYGVSGIGFEVGQGLPGAASLAVEAGVGWEDGYGLAAFGDVAAGVVGSAVAEGCGAEPVAVVVGGVGDVGAGGDVDVD